MRPPQTPVDGGTPLATEIAALRNRATELFLGTPVHWASRRRLQCRPEERTMNGIIYLVGLIVIIMFILSFLGLR